jgi:hypothetical protein
MLSEIRFLSATVAWLGLVAILGGCATELESPRYSPDFAVDLPGDARPFPDVCLAIADGAGAPRLPTGCANALNLQRMVERPDDLRRGRDAGPSFAAPVAQAAERYLRGDNEDERERSRRLEQESSTGGAP